MKKKGSLPTLLLAMLLLFTGCSFGRSEVTVHSVAGNVVECSDTNLVLSTSSAQYQFDLSAAEQMENGLSLSAGCQAVVYYTGDLSNQEAVPALRYQVTRPLRRIKPSLPQAARRSPRRWRTCTTA